MAGTPGGGSFRFSQKCFLWRERQGSNRVNRGGSWNNNARNCRSANRNNNDPDNRNNNLGFRVALCEFKYRMDVRD